MPYALLSISGNIRQSDKPNILLSAENGEGLPEGTKQYPGNTLQMPLPGSLPYISRLITQLDQYKVPYAIAFLDSELEFSTFNNECFSLR